MNSRYLLFEAQSAYYYGLPENLAIASVTSTPAKLLGLGHRVGFVKEGKRLFCFSVSRWVFLTVAGPQVGMQVRGNVRCTGR